MSRSHLRTGVASSIALIAAALPSGAAWAQTAGASKPATADENNVLNEIVVTSARKRNEDAQSTPIAIAAIGAAQLERSQVTSIENIQRLTPNLQIRKAQSSADVVSIFLRGFGTRTNDPIVNPAVSINVDGIYQASVSGSAIDLFDVETVEVLKGPQGTLLGKNSPSGAINVTTKRPTGDFSGKAEVRFENYKRFEARALLNVPIVKDVLSAKASVLIKDGGNYLNTYGADAFVPTGGTTPIGLPYVRLNPDAPHTREFGGDKVVVARLGLLFKPSPDFDWYLTSTYVRNRSPQTPIRNLSVNSGAPTTPAGYEDVPIGAPVACSLFGFCTPSPEWSVAPNRKAKLHVDSYDITSIANYRTEPVTLTSVTGYRHYDGTNNTDVDALPVDIFYAYDNRVLLKQFSQEFRVASNKGGGLDLGGKLDWLVGAYYFWSHFSYDQPFNGGAISQTSHQTTKSYALFAHAEYHLTDQWAVTLGARHTWDSKNGDSNGNFAQFIQVQQKSKNFSVEAGTSYKFDPDKMVYFRFAQGYRGGGLQSFPSTVAGATPYRPETVDSFELGAKTEWLNRHLRVNVDLFYNKYHDLQRDAYLQGAQGQSILVVQNAANATTKGIELEVIAVPTDRITLRGSMGYLEAKYQNYFADALGFPGSSPRDNSKYPFPSTPKWTGSAGADLILMENDRFGKLTQTIDYNYVGRRNLSPLDFPATRAKPYSLVDLGLRYDDPSRKYSVTLYAHNVFNKYYLVSIENVSGIITTGLEGNPRTFGVSLAASF